MAALCVITRHFRTGAALSAVALCWLGLCATPAFATWLQNGLESPYPQRAVASYPNAEAIVILGGGELPQFDDDTPGQKAAARDTRTGFGLALFRAGHAPFMLLTGGNYEAVPMSRLLEQQGVPASALQIEAVSSNTHENALYSAALLRRDKVQRILLVTSAIHMRRAAASFERQGLLVIPAPAATQQWSLPHPWWPQRAALHRSGRYLREYLGLGIYKLRGWA